jgi:hypothetical protein
MMTAPSDVPTASFCVPLWKSMVENLPSAQLRTKGESLMSRALEMQANQITNKEERRRLLDQARRPRLRLLVGMKE